jgi:osmotically-inducible protein OsmY
LLLFAWWLALPTSLQAQGMESAPNIVTDAVKLQGVDEDARLQVFIEQRLSWDRKLAPFMLEVEVSAAVVSLGGTVSTPYERHRARRIAEHAGGIAGVVNGIKVDAALGPFIEARLGNPSDAVLRRRIEKILTASRRVPADRIGVGVDRGHVVLSGEVHDIGQRLRAGQLARSLHGVKSLTNQIRTETFGH